MSITEREFIENHFKSYNEGHMDGYREGYNDGWQEAAKSGRPLPHPLIRGKGPTQSLRGNGPSAVKKKRKPSAWNKFVKANSKKPRFKYRNGKLNLKKMAVAFRKTPAGKKKRR